MRTEDLSTQEEQSLSNLHPLEVLVLKDLHKNSPITEVALVEHTGLEPAQVSMSIGWLQAKKYIQTSSESILKTVSLTPTGIEFSKSGSLLEKVFNSAIKYKQNNYYIYLKTNHKISAKYFCYLIFVY